MSARAFDIMNELPAIFATVPGIEAANVEVGRFRDPSGIPESELPRVLVYNPTSEEPAAPSYGLRRIEFGFAVLVVDGVDDHSVTLEKMEQMAVALSSASLTNADRAYMAPGSIQTAEGEEQSVAVSILLAEWEGL